MRKKSLLTSFPCSSLSRKLMNVVCALFLFALPATVYGQSVTVNGTVKDNFGAAIVGATISSGTVGTISDAMGAYSVTVPANSQLTVTYIGYQSQTIPVNSRTSIDFVMEEEINVMDDVIVVGYGTQRRGSITGSITAINPEDIMDTPYANLSTALAGRLSGVQISSGTGRPGSTSSISIRAQGTINDAEPLYVIDGAVRDKMAFDALDQSEVSNISVLKDGASAAIYGSRAANGVVLITTKRGSSSKPIIYYSGSVGIDSPVSIPKVMNAYEHAVYMNDSSYAGFITNPNRQPADDPTGKAAWYTDDELEHFKTHSYSQLDEAWRTPVSTRHVVNVSGGNESVRYFMGGSFFYNTGSFDNLIYQKQNFRASVDADILKNLTGSLNISTDRRQDEKPYWPSDGGDSNGIANDRVAMDDLYKGLLLRTQAVPAFINGLPVANNGIEWHPMMLISKESGEQIKKWQNVNVNANLEYSFPFLKGLKAKVMYNQSTDNYLQKTVDFPYTMYFFKTAGTNNHYVDPSNELTGLTRERKVNNFIKKVNRLSTSYQLNGFLTYNTVWGKNALDALFVYEQSEGKSEQFDGRRDNLITWEIPEFFAASGDVTDSQVSGGRLSESARISYVSRINYAYDNKYLIEAALRVDGSTKFAPAERWGYFPSVSAGWRISSESFFADNIRFINYLKLRGSIASLGNDAVGGWQWLPRYNISSDGAVFENMQYALLPGEVPNPNLTWEKSISYNIGFDSNWFKNRLNFTFEYFYRKTKDILDERIASVPTTYGAKLPKENWSEISSRGFELEMAWNGRVGKDFKYRAYGNFGYATSKWDKRDEAYNQRPYLSEIGQPVGREWGYKCIGIIRTQEQLDKLLQDNLDKYGVPLKVLGQDPRLGMLMYEDVRGVNGDEPDGIITTDDKIVVVNRKSPPIIYGFGFSGQWKGLAIDILFQGLAGHTKVNNYRTTGFNIHTSTFAWKNDHWTPDNPNASQPSGQGNKNGEVSTFWARSASSLRLKNVTISYSLPKHWLQKVHVEGIRVFATGTNLLLLQNNIYWMDPEASRATDYPVMQNFSFGLNFTI